jgi:hypothetical protein
MATVKAYTDIIQSKKLAEILPIESADIYYQAYYDSKNNLRYIPRFSSTFVPFKVDIPAWTFITLFEILPSATLDSSNDHHYRLHCMERFTEWHDNAIDACCEMIIKLHELKML